MPIHTEVSSSEIAVADIILVNQQKKEVRVITLVGTSYEFTLYNWPVRPASEPESIVYEQDATVIRIDEDDIVEDTDED